MFRCVITPLLLISSLLMSAQAVAEKVIFVTEELPPFQMLDQQGKPQGVAIDIIEVLIAETNIEAEIKFFPWARAFNTAKNTKNTFIFSILKSDARTPDFHWLGKIMTVQAYLAAKAKKGIAKMSSIEDAHDHNIVTVRGSLAHEYLKERGFVENKNLYLTATFGNMWQTLFSDHVDLVITNNALYKTQIANAGYALNEVEFVLTLDDFSSEMYLAANLSTDQALLDKMRQAFAKMKQDGRYDAILKKWGLSAK